MRPLCKIITTGSFQTTPNVSRDSSNFEMAVQLRSRQLTGFMATYLFFFCHIDHFQTVTVITSVISRNTFAILTGAFLACYFKQNLSTMTINIVQVNSISLLLLSLLLIISMSIIVQLCKLQIYLLHINVCRVCTNVCRSENACLSTYQRMSFLLCHSSQAYGCGCTCMFMCENVQGIASHVFKIYHME